MMLADVVRRDPRFSDEQIDAITATAHDKIANWAIELNDWRLANAAPAPSMPSRSNPSAAPAQNVGRNTAKRAMPLRLWQKIQKMLRPQLSAKPHRAVTGRLRLICRMVSSLSAGIGVPSIARGLMPEGLTQTKTPDSPKPGRGLIGTPAGFKSEWWPTSNWNGGWLQIGIPGRNESESAAGNMLARMMVLVDGKAAHLTSTAVLGEKAT
ncbi:MAG: hypothetical protein RSE11_19940 [Bosea sp. (in: a-proteobacteria)]|nr:hypothetical protein [Bosea sp. (in: a-proteobacteria)]WRH57246.1 MAG: hypothetical protein RSE11_19940 [Bosea sp. (in: a-proteobacteria)]